jgi:hypothetical protein
MLPLRSAQLVTQFSHARGRPVALSPAERRHRAKRTVRLTPAGPAGFESGRAALARRVRSDT